MTISNRISAFWDRTSEKLDINTTPTRSQYVFSVIEYLKSHDAKDVLDLGCGYGLWSIELARQGFKVTAVDISRKAISLLEKLAEGHGLSIGTHVCAAQNLNDVPSTFDAIVCNSVLDHMPLSDTQLSVRNINSKLNRKGIAFLSFDGPEEIEINKPNIEVLEDGTWQYISGPQKGMLWRYYKDEEIERLCNNMNVLEFRTEVNGKRCIWYQKNKPKRLQWNSTC